MKKFWKDLAERTISTYVQVFLGLLIAGGVFGTDGAIDMSAGKAAAVSAIPAALAVVKGLIASQFGEEDSASLAKDV